MHAPASPPAPKGLSWFAIIRIGLVQASIGAMVMLITFAFLNTLSLNAPRNWVANSGRKRREPRRLNWVGFIE